MTNIIDLTWTKKSQKLSAILDRGARISDELFAIADAARQRLSGIPDDHDDIGENRPSVGN